MNGRRAIIGLCMLCALLTSAIAAQSASAITGTTAVTCAKTGGTQVGVQTFNEAHCKPGSASGEYEHYRIPDYIPTEEVSTAGSATTKLKATVGGVATTFTSTNLTGTGTMENRVAPNGEHFWVRAFKFYLHNVSPSPFPKCFVYTDDGTGTPGAKETIDTENLTATTQGQGDAVKIAPEEGEVFAKFWVLDAAKKGAGGECAIPGTYTVTGSVIATPEGATASTTHAGVTEQNTLKLGTGESQIKAGIEGSVTNKGRTTESLEPFNALSTTTVTT